MLARSLGHYPFLKTGLETHKAQWARTPQGEPRTARPAEERGGRRDIFLPVTHFLFSLDGLFVSSEKQCFIHYDVFFFTCLLPHSATHKVSQTRQGWHRTYSRGERRAMDQLLCTVQLLTMVSAVKLILANTLCFETANG